MLKKRLFAAGAGLLAAATFTIAGCNAQQDPTGSATTAPATSAPAQDPKEAFVEAVNKLNDQSVKADVVLDGLVKMTGTHQLDPTAKKATSTLDVSVGSIQIKLSLLASGTDIWAKLAGIPGLDGTKWLHTTTEKVKDGSLLDVSKDSPEAWADAVVDVERDGANGYKGTIDVTKVKSLPEEVAQELDDKATAVPFTATVDDQGRLTSMAINMNNISLGMGVMKTTYSAFGEPVTVTPPAAADIVEMPQSILDQLSQ